MKQNILIIILTLVGIPGIFAQDFVNLDFESANLSGDSAGSVSASDAIPGWTAYLGGVPLTSINYDEPTRQFIGSEIDIIDSSNSGLIGIQGNYGIYIKGEEPNSISIGQTGTIPLSAQYLIFFGGFLLGSDDTVSFNGNNLALSVVGSGSNYNIYQAYIGNFAGQTGQLLFTSSSIFPNPPPGDTIDSIQFSVSEPPQSLLFLLGSGVFIYVRRNKGHFYL